MKNLVLITSLLCAATPVLAETVTATIEDRYVTQNIRTPHTKNECVLVDVPIRSNKNAQNSAGGGALLGMLLGGLAGKGLTGDDHGAAVGAIFGGIVGADKGAQVNNTGGFQNFRTEERCSKVTYYTNEEQTVYSYSLIKWEENGKKYSQRFQK